VVDRQPTHTPRPLKAVILAAGAKSITEDGLPVLLQDLGGRKIIDYVTANVAHGMPVGPADTYVVVGYRPDAIHAHLGPGYHCVVQ
jgi:choline kinase